MKSKMLRQFSRLILVTFIFGVVQSVSAEDAISQEDRESLSKAFRRLEKDSGSEDGSESLFSQQAKLTAFDGANDDNFGSDVALVGDTAVVGMPQDDIGGNGDQGSAYVFVRSNSGVWSFQQKLVASDGAAGDTFGSSMAIANVSNPSQTVIMIGALGDDINANSNQGSVYTFVRSSGGTTWSQQGKLTASDGVANDVFGVSVAMTGTFTIIGANGADIGVNGSQGAAYVFVRSGTAWLEEQKLVQTTNSGAAANGNFGWSVGISGERAIVGTNYTVSSDGRIVIFERTPGGNTWNLTASSGPENNGTEFGMSVAISGDHAVVGAYLYDSDGIADRGQARVLTRSAGGWSYGPILVAADAAVGDNLGVSVAIDGNKIYAGAVGNDGGGLFERGAVYVFEGAANNWTQTHKLLDSLAGSGDFLGYSIAASGDTVISGAWNDDVGMLGQAGSVSVFKFSNAAAPFDFDGDAKTDLSIRRNGSSGSEWWLNRSSSGATNAFVFGLQTDVIVPADFTGDGKTDVAFFRPSSGSWFVLRSEDFSFFSFPFGAGGDVPVPADFDADGRADPAVFRPSTNTWFVNKSSGGTDILGFGIAGDVPTVADYDGDAKADIAIYRPNAAGGGQWWIRRSTNGSVFATVFGSSTDRTVQGDYTGDGKADIAFFRPSNGNWFVLRSEDLSFFSFPFGANGDIPVPGDYDGDGRADGGIFRPSSSTWFVNKSSGGTSIQTFGIAGDTPLPSAFVR